MIFEKCLTGHGQRRLFTIEQAASGWVAREQRDSLTRTSVIRDWRQVEATMALFELRASALRNEGWAEISPNL